MISMTFADAVEAKPWPRITSVSPLEPTLVSPSKLSTRGKFEELKTVVAVPSATFPFPFTCTESVGLVVKLIGGDRHATHWAPEEDRARLRHGISLMLTKVLLIFSVSSYPVPQIWTNVCPAKEICVGEIEARTGVIAAVV